MTIKASSSSSPNILLTNDDGILAPSLPPLIQSLSQIGDIYVAAPHTQQSGVGKSLAYHTPLRATEIKLPPAVQALSIEGTPAASVLFAIRHKNAPKFDLVISGINRGHNVSLYNLFASGTVGAAVEATLLGVPSIAVSMDAPPKQWFGNHAGNIVTDKHVQFVKKVGQLIIEQKMPPNVDLLNINFPLEITDSTEIVITPLARRGYLDRPEARKDLYGGDYYWIGLGDQLDVKLGTDVDIANKKTDISITPITLQLSTEAGLEALSYYLRDTFKIQKKGR